MNMQTCMNSNLFDAPIRCSKEPILFKTWWNHGLNIIMNMHVTFLPWKQLKHLQYKHACMEWASIQQQWTNSRLRSLEAQESCMNKLKHNKEGLSSLPRALVTRRGSLICNLCSNSFNYQAIYKQNWDEIHSSSFSLSMVGNEKEKGWTKCVLKCNELKGV